MRILFFYTGFVLQIIFAFKVNGQIDTDPPAAPELKLVTINQSTGNVELSWSTSISPDVSGYVVYLFHNNEGYVLDTIRNPHATSYLRSGSGSSYFSESYVVAALDSAKNISPLSNELRTIYSEAKIDTCNKKIEITWNQYPSYPVQVLNYSVFISAGGAPFTNAGQTTADKSNFIINDFITSVQYCYIVRANLQGGQFSESNKPCLLTKMKRPPQWINADYATVNAGKEILLSFKIDPSSEIRNFRLEKKTGAQGTFKEIQQFSSVSGTILYNDGNADISKVNYYRLSAVNNCNAVAAVSNIASNIALTLERNNDDIKLKWNPYKDWVGGVGSYKVFANTRGALSEWMVLTSSDSALNINYSELMYQADGKEVCFMIKAAEASNPYGDPGESSSPVVCTPVTEVVTVPNVFTPDNNGLNDMFWPVLSFTPVSYQLVITDLQRKIVFETRNPGEKWDGTKNGDPLPEGAYLWYLKAVAPSGKSISRTGNVTIIINH
jgi:gliding motility-associated-like protein